MRIRNCVLVLNLCFAVNVVCGCSSNSGDRHGVSGEIKFKGKLLDQGSIEFSSDAKKKYSFAGATIKDGRYSIANDKGLSPGVYKVTITSSDATTDKNAMPGQTGPPAKERIPATYNVNSKITFEVKAGRTNTFDLSIP